MNNNNLQEALDELYLLQERSEQQRSELLKQFQQSLTEQRKSLEETKNVLESTKILPEKMQKTLDEALLHFRRYRWYLSLLVSGGIVLVMFIALLCVKGFALSLKQEVENSQAELIAQRSIRLDEQRLLQEAEQRFKRLPKFEGQDGRWYVAVDTNTTIDRYDKDGSVITYAAVK